MTTKSLACLLVAAVVALSAGCAGQMQSVGGADCYNKPLPALLDATDLKALFQGMAAELCADRRPVCPQDGKGAGDAAACLERDQVPRTTVLVTDFADLQSYAPNASGILMGELMRGALNDVCNNRIVQAEFGKYFKLSENGLVVLSRKAAEIKHSDYGEPEVVVGTYNYLNNNKVLVFARRINTESGEIPRMVTREVNYTCGGRYITGYTLK